MSDESKAEAEIRASERERIAESIELRIALGESALAQAPWDARHWRMIAVLNAYRDSLGIARAATQCEFCSSRDIEPGHAGYRCRECGFCRSTLMEGRSIGEVKAKGEIRADEREWGATEERARIVAWLRTGPPEIWANSGEAEQIADVIEWLAGDTDEGPSVPWRPPLPWER